MPHGQKHRAQYSVFAGTYCASVLGPVLVLPNCTGVLAVVPSGVDLSPEREDSIGRVFGVERYRKVERRLPVLRSIIAPRQYQRSYHATTVQYKRS
eukprot:2443604-Rhodomonas_salina.2